MIMSTATTTTSTGWKIISPPLTTVFIVSKKKSCNDNLHISTTNHQTSRPIRTPHLQEQGPVINPLTNPLQQQQQPPDKKKRKKKIRSSTATATVTDILRLMDSLQFPIPNNVYASLLKECTHLRDAKGGAEVHAHINRACHRGGGGRRALPGLRLDNRLLLMYASCGRLDAARQVFDKMAIRDSFSWMTMIAGYVDNDDPAEALRLFDQMLQRRNLKGYEITSLIIPCILNACINTNNLEFGKQVHGWVLKKMRRTSCGDGDGTAGEDYSFLHSLFIVFYGKFKCTESARRVFDQIRHRDTVMWTAMIVEYCRGEQFEKAIKVFKEMGKAGTRKNHFTFSSVLRACGRMGDGGWCGRQVHADAIKRGMASESDSSFVQTSLVDMYGKCGLLKDARMVFEMMLVSSYKEQRNEVCWNAMLNSYTRQGFHNEAIKLLYLMKAGGLQPPESMVIQLRMACG